MKSLILQNIVEEIPLNNLPLLWENSDLIKAVNPSQIIFV